MAQKIVNTKLAFGVEGEFYDSSIKRATNRKLAAAAKFGKALFFVAADGTVTPTYNSSTASSFAGIMVNPKEHINASAGLASTLELGAGKTAGVADVGRVIVKAANAVKVGYKAYTCVTAGTATGTATTNYAIGDIVGGATAAPSSTAAAGGVFVEIGSFDIVDAAANELAVVVLG